MTQSLLTRSAFSSCARHDKFPKRDPQRPACPAWQAHRDRGIPPGTPSDPPSGGKVMKEEKISSTARPERKKSWTLSPRLDAMRRWVGAAPYLVDVGTDHALLPLAWLAQHPQAKALGIDQAQLPLQRAEQNRKRCPPGHRLELRLQSGLGSLAPPPQAVLSISGMGGLSIQAILSDAVCVRCHQLARVVLSPNDRFDAVRASLIELGWRICAEDALWDRGRFYPIICAQPARAPELKPCPLALAFGPELLGNQHPALATWLHLQALRLAQIQARLAPNPAPKPLVHNLRAIESAWAQYFKNRYGELESPQRLTVPPTTKQT